MTEYLSYEIELVDLGNTQRGHTSRGEERQIASMAEESSAYFPSAPLVEL